MFVGRKRELDSLNNAYNRGCFQFSVIYGRRRIGKTTLINEFCRGKKSVYFVAVQSTAKENLEILSAQIISALAPGSPRNPFTTFREAIEFVFDRTKNEQVIFAIDEYPYLAGSDRSVSSILQAAIDKHQGESKLFLILCGSSMSFMERQVLGYESPLYGRSTAQYKLLPFDYLESADMLAGFNYEEKIVLYGITGGIPEYLARIDTKQCAKDNIAALFFEPSGRLFEEPSSLLKQELKIPETYNAIIAAIAGGSNKLNQISTRAGIETSQCAKMLSTLTSLGLVRRELPVTETAASKKSIYVLDDWMFVFWYRFVRPELSRIAIGLGRTVLEGIFAESIHSYTGRVFEECAIVYMWHLLKCGNPNNRIPVSFSKIGRWWGNNPKEHREEEIDLFAYSADSQAIFGECKWRTPLVGDDVLDELIRKASLFTRFTEVWYILFSKSGFTDSLKLRAADQKRHIMLICAEDMFLIA